MSRSNLTTRYHLGVIGKFEKTFKENYKKENGEALKGSVISYITIGVIQRNRLPEVSDCLTLIKLGNNNCDDTQAQDILNRWFEDEENKSRGLVGAFCDLCKDLCIDIPINLMFTEQINNLEENINKNKLAGGANVAELLKQLKTLSENKENIEKLNNKLGEKKDTQE